ncbi:MAG: hypothetical protein QW840_01945 [Candidatus Bathyarchaeia archaeon]
MRTESIELDDRFGSEYAGRYVLGEITWAKRSRIIQKHTKYHPLTGQVVSSDFIAIQAETIWASLREQPLHKPVTLEKLLGEEDGIPIGLGELLSQVANRLNSVTQEENCFLLGQSEGKSQTSCLPISDSAKSSVGHRVSSLNSQPKPSSSSS